MGNREYDKLFYVRRLISLNGWQIRPNLEYAIETKGRLGMNLSDLSSVQIVAQNRTAASRRCVYFCVDQKFFKFALFVANQIATKFQSRDFDICIVSAEALDPHPLVEHHNIRVCQIDTGDLSNQVPSDERISFAAYLRILVPSVFKDDYDHLLYLDADFFYQRGDLNQLLDLDLKGKAVGAVRDMVQLRKPERNTKDFELFGLPFGKYFNSGLLLIDTAEWQKQKVGEKTISIAAQNFDRLPYHDQTALNVALHNNWAELSLVWNYEYSHQTMYFSAMFDVCFFHFIGRRKPFKGDYGGFPKRITDEYNAFFAQHFPKASVGLQDGLDIENKWIKHVFVFIFHMLNARRFLRNDGRFQSDWDVII